MQIKTISILVLQISSLLAYAAPAGPTDQQTTSPVPIQDAQKLATGPIAPSPQGATTPNSNAVPGPLDFFQKVGRGLEAAIACIIATPDLKCAEQFTAPFAGTAQNPDALTPAQTQLIGEFERGVKAVSACMLTAGESMAAKKQCWDLFRSPATTAAPAPAPAPASDPSLNPQQQNFLDSLSQGVKEAAACFTTQGLKATSCYDPVIKKFQEAQQNPAALQ